MHLFPDYNSEESNTSIALTGGLDLKKYTDRAFTLGLGFNYVYLDFGKHYITSEASPEILGRFHAYETCAALTASLASFEASPFSAS